MLTCTKLHLQRGEGIWGSIAHKAAAVDNVDVLYVSPLKTKIRVLTIKKCELLDEKYI